MNPLDHLATALGRRDEAPNQELAKRLVATKDKKAVKILAENIDHKDKAIRSDVIKTLYEIGEREPALIADYADVFLKLLKDKNNRLVWGAMTALDYIAAINPKGIHKHLALIMEVSDKGSVITKDHAMGILTKLAGQKEYSNQALTILLDQMKFSATNQLPKYAEEALPVISAKFKKEFHQVLSKRLSDYEDSPKKKRLEKVLKKLSN